MFKNAARFATFAIAGTLVVGGGIISANAESAYNSTAVAGITLSVNDYVSSIEDETPAVASTGATDTTASADATAKKSDKNAKFVAANVENAVNVRKKNSTDSEIIGQMYKGDTGKLVKKGKNWSKIKSGNVKGWVKNEFLLFGDEAKEYADKICAKTAVVKTTTLNVRAKKSTDSDVVTLIPEGGEYSVSKVYDNWVKISIDGDLKGYVSTDYVKVKTEYGEALTMKEIQEIEEANAAAEAAEAAAVANNAVTTTQETVTTTSEQSVSTIKPTKKSTIKSNSNGSSFSSNSSVASSSTSTSGLGSKIASYALQFVGNPYRYGGTSLTKGADCSGFVQSVYAHFGYSLSRTAAAQASNGTSVSFSNLQPGDLIFYNNGGGIGHVAIYTGGGMVVHASNRKDGIKTSAYNYRTPCKAVRIVK